MRRSAYLAVIAWVVAVPMGFHAIGTVVLIVGAALAVPYVLSEIRLGWRIGGLVRSRRRIPLVDLRLARD